MRRTIQSGTIILQIQRVQVRSFYNSEVTKEAYHYGRKDHGPVIRGIYGCKIPILNFLLIKFLLINFLFR